MSGLFNRYLTNTQGQALLPEPVPMLRAEGAPLTREQFDMAKFAFDRYLERSHLSFVPNPVEQGFLPDGSRYRAGAVGGMRIMQVWPVVPGGVDETVVEFYGGFVFELEGEYYVVDVIPTEGGEWYEHSGAWTARKIKAPEWGAWYKAHDKDGLGGIEVTDPRIRGIAYVYYDRSHPNRQHSWRGLPLLKGFMRFATTYNGGVGGIYVGGVITAIPVLIDGESLYGLRIQRIPYTPPINSDAVLSGRLGHPPELDFGGVVTTEPGKYIIAVNGQDSVLRNGVQVVAYDIENLGTVAQDIHLLEANPSGGASTWLVPSDGWRSFGSLASYYSLNDAQVLKLTAEIYNIESQKTDEVLPYSLTRYKNVYPKYFPNLSVVLSPENRIRYRPLNLDTIDFTGYREMVFTDFSREVHKDRLYNPYIKGNSSPPFHYELDVEYFLRNSTHRVTPGRVRIGTDGTPYYTTRKVDSEYSAYSTFDYDISAAIGYFSVPEGEISTINHSDGFISGAVLHHYEIMASGGPLVENFYIEENFSEVEQVDIGPYNIRLYECGISTHIRVVSTSYWGAGSDRKFRTRREFECYARASRTRRAILHYDHFLDLLVYGVVEYGGTINGTSVGDAAVDVLGTSSGDEPWSYEGTGRPSVEDVKATSMTIFIQHKGKVVHSFAARPPGTSLSVYSSFIGLPWIEYEDRDYGRIDGVAVSTATRLVRAPGALYKSTRKMRVPGYASVLTNVRTMLDVHPSITWPELSYDVSPGTGAKLITIDLLNGNEVRLFVDKNQIKSMDDTIDGLELTGAEFKEYTI